MDSIQRNKTWVRWLEGRKLERAEAAALAKEMEADETLAKQLWSDLDVHRQLEAAQKLEADDFTFVGRMMARFEVEKAHRFDSTGVPQSESVLSTEPPLADMQTLPREAPPVVGMPKQNYPNQAEDDLRISATQSSKPRTKKTTMRILVLAACFLLMASMVWLAYETGRRNGPASVAGKQDDAATDSPRAVTGNDELPVLPGLQSADDGLVNQGSPDDNEHVSTEGTVEPRSGADQIAIKEPAQSTETLNEQAELTVAPTTFAKIIDSQAATWSKRPKEWPRIGDQQLELQSGTATFELDQGGEFTVTGPAKFSVGEQGVDFQSGQVAFVMPDLGDEKFVVNARNNQIQPTGVTRFNLNVDDRISDLKVERGAIEVNPWFGRMVTKPMELNANKQNHLTIEGHDGAQPAVARLMGEKDRYEGWINFQDRVLKSTDSELVDDLFRRAKKRYSESPQQLGQEWKNLTDLATDQLPRGPNRLGNPPLQNPPQMEQMRKQMQEMMEQMQQRAREAARNGGQGGFNFSFDGKDFQFQSEGDFESMEEQLLGPFADLAERLKRGK